MRFLQDPLAQRLAWTLVHFLWQGAALGILAWAVLSMLKRKSPQSRYLVACLFLSACLVVPVTTFARLRQTPRASQMTSLEETGPTRTVTFKTISTLRRQVQPALPGILATWSLMVCLLSLRTFGSWLWLRRVKRSARPILEGEWALRLQRLLRRAGIHRSVRLLESCQVQSPFTLGMLKPVILVPVGFFTGLDPVAAEAVLAHELAHVRRLDVLVIGLQSVLETLLFYHPAVWWISRRVRTEREHCCDDAAVQACGDPVRFAEILNLLSALDPMPRVQAPAALGSPVLERIRRLVGMDPGRPRFALPSASIFVTSALCATLAAHQEPVQRKFREIPLKLVELGNAILHRTQEEAKGAEVALSGEKSESFAPPITSPVPEPGPLASHLTPNLGEVPNLPLVPAPSVTPNHVVEIRSEAFPEANVSALCQALRKPQLDSEAHELKDWTLELGHATYHLTGRAAYLRAKNKVVGIYFTGTGSCRYVTRNSIELPVLRYNLRQQAKLKAQPCPEGTAISDTLDEALFWFGGLVPPSLPAQPASLAPTHLSQALDQMVSQDPSAFAQDLAQRAVGSNLKPFTHVQMRNHLRTWFHTVDESDSEILAISRQRAYPNGLSHPKTILSRQPIGWTYQLPASPRLALTNVDLELDAQTRCGALTAIETFLPLQEGMKTLDLQMDSAFMALDTWKGSKVQYLKIDSVQDEQGRSLPFDHQDNRLLIGTGPLAKDTPVRIRVHITNLLPATREWTMDSPSWFPVPRDLAGRAFQVHAKVRTPKDGLALMMGTTLHRSGEELETRLNHPVQSYAITMTHGGKLEEATRNGITVRWISAPYITRSARTAYEDNLFARISRAEALFGPLPLQEINLDSRFESLPHLYWGLCVQPFSEADRWLCWSLEDYARTLLNLGSRGGKEAFDNNVKHWPKALESAGHMAPLPLAMSLDPQDGNQLDQAAQAQLASTKGVYLMYRLHADMGDEAFLQFMRAFQKTFAWKRCLTANLPALLQAVSGRDYSRMLQECVWSTGMPGPELRPSETKQAIQSPKTTKSTEAP